MFDASLGATLQIPMVVCLPAPFFADFALGWGVGGFVIRFKKAFFQIGPESRASWEEILGLRRHESQGGMFELRSDDSFPGLDGWVCLF